MSIMYERLPKSITFMFLTHKLKFHSFKSTKHKFQQALKHGRRRVHAKSLYVLKISYPAPSLLNSFVKVDFMDFMAVRQKFPKSES